MSLPVSILDTWKFRLRFVEHHFPFWYGAFLPRFARHLPTAWYGTFSKVSGRASRGTVSLLGTELSPFPRARVRTVTVTSKSVSHALTR